MRLRKFIFYISIFLSFEVFASDSNKALCTASDGLWRVFNHNCFDKCAKIIDKNTPCYRLLEYGCDCGVDKCWQGNKCILDKTLKSKKYKIYHGQKPKIQEVESEDNVENIITDQKSSFLDFFSDLSESVDGQESESCQKTGGKMKDFRNSCADNCGIKKGVFCAQIITKSCDCGPDKCWDKIKCIKNDTR
ncbi:hypothetical protein N8772_01100 [Rickettsiales bacterium]|nr:hypothetical protein [Rickettsiales bacterium]MDB2550362.1 hypothetical protein [Rickettsiales bacterium]